MGDRFTRETIEDVCVHRTQLLNAVGMLLERYGNDKCECVFGGGVGEICAVCFAKVVRDDVVNDMVIGEA